MKTLNFFPIMNGFDVLLEVAFVCKHVTTMRTRECIAFMNCFNVNFKIAFLCKLLFAVMALNFHPFVNRNYGQNHSTWTACIVKFCYFGNQNHSYISPGTIQIA